jgi:phosphatidylinositol phospholipase C delta
VLSLSLCLVDVWDGDDGEPIVTHGRTLTSKIPVRNILQAIAQYAFLASPYPVVLSVEVHCDLSQQDKLAVIFQETLGDRLVCKPLEQMEADKEIEKLPSPADLKGKFLLKVRPPSLLT